MEKLKATWYRLVAPALLGRIAQLERSRAEWEKQFDNQVLVVKSWVDECKRLDALYRETDEKLIEAQAEVEIVRNNDNTGLASCINSSRSRAAKQRIMDLEAQLRSHGIEPQ